MRKVSRRPAPFRTAAAVTACVVLVAACGGDSQEATLPNTRSAPLPFALEALVAATSWRTAGSDTFEVWVCEVAEGATDPIYAGLPLRLDLTPDGIIEAVAEGAADYFDALSDGAYHPEFVVGGVAELGVNDPPQTCIDQAIEGAAADVNGVLVVANAEHGSDQPGGFANASGRCVQPPCSVAESRRYVYMGASDFHPDWGDAPPLDLLEHELGHAIGWYHSGIGDDGAYLSSLDVMSNNAARRSTDPELRDAQGTLALNLLMAGWLEPGQVWTAPIAGGAVTLAPNTSDTNVSLVVLPIDHDHFVTVELLTADGLNSHLPESGLAVHMVTLANGVIERVHPFAGEPPFTDLAQVGEDLTVEWWQIAIGDGYRLTITGR